MRKLYFFLSLCSAALIITAGVLLFRGLTAESLAATTYSAEKDAERYLSLPYSGGNFTAGSPAAFGAGRCYLKGKVAATVVAAYDLVAKELPEVHFIYGETGFRGGGRFWPHRTHKTGMSADFITPVYIMDASGRKKTATLPCRVTNLWGYSIRIDADGRFGEYRLDAPAMIAHLAALQKAGAAYGVRVDRVIFDPPLLKLLRRDTNFQRLGNMRFMEQKAWFPHDGHYHVDFTTR